MRFLNKTAEYQNLINSSDELNKIQLIGFIGAIIMIVGSFLDFATFSLASEGINVLSFPINYFMQDGDIKDGLYITALAVAIIFFIFKKKPFKVLLLSIISLGVVLIDYKDSIEMVETFKDAYGSGMSLYGIEAKVTLGPAFFLCAIGAIIVILYFVLYFLKAAKMNKVLNDTGYTNTNLVNNQTQTMPNEYPTPNFNQPMNYEKQPNEYSNSDFGNNV